jgi:hypothetical protein
MAGFAGPRLNSCSKGLGVELLGVGHIDSPSKSDRVLQATALRRARATQGAAARTGVLLRLMEQQTLKSCDTDKGE